MLIILGLGNPGQKFAKHRHNIGYQAVEAIAHKEGLHCAEKAVFHAEVCQCTHYILAKPTTWMNDAGVAARALFKQFCQNDGHLVVIYDDINIALGQVKCSYDRGSGGHNGVQSVIDYMGTRQFFRIRVGVRPLHEALQDRIAPPDGFEKFLLSDFAPFEKDKVAEGIAKTLAIVEDLKTKTFEEVMNLYNTVK